MPGLSTGLPSGDSKKRIMRILQLNLNHCEAAQDLLTQTVRELQIDVAILCEQYRNYGDAAWVSDTSGRAAIWTCGKYHAQETMRVAASGFVWARVDDIYIYSVYAPPNAPIEEFEALLDRLADDVRGRRSAIVAGDFNARAKDWGSRRTNRRGDNLLDTFAPLDIVLINTGDKPTFTRGSTGSVVDLMFASESLADSGLAWGVWDGYTHSDHQAILCVVDKSGGPRKVKANQSGNRWSPKSFDGESFIVAMEQEVTLSGPPDDMAEQMMTLIASACDASMPRSLTRSHRTPVYWWNGAIAELRGKCHKSRRLYQRARKRENCRILRDQYNHDRRALNKAIKASKRGFWRELCEQVDMDPWGRPYRTVMARLKILPMPVPTCPVLLRKIVAALFPQQPELRTDVASLPHFDDVIPIETDELLAACRKVGDNKAPGLDGIPNVALKLAIRTRPEMFLGIYNECLRKGIFPRRWKQQRLVLLSKGKKAPDDPSSYRPICLLDTAGKILERIICNRLDSFIEETQGLSENQYGFRRARSTVDAIDKLIEKARGAIEGKRWRRGAKKYCAVVTLDVKNAFNSARWSCILDALQHLAVPEYIRSIVADYFRDRKLTY